MMNFSNRRIDGQVKVLTNEEVSKVNSFTSHLNLHLVSKKSVGPTFEYIDQDVKPSKAAFVLNDPKICVAFALFDAFTLFLSSMMSWIVIHQLSANSMAHLQLYLATSSALAFIFVLIAITGKCYNFLWGIRHFESINDTFRAFILTFALFVTLLFFSQLAESYSRLTFALQFFVCCFTLLALRSMQFQILHKTKFGKMVIANRVILIGSTDEIARTNRYWRENNENVQVVAAYPIDVITGATALSNKSTLEFAEMVQQQCRDEKPDRILILSPLRPQKMNNLLISRLSELPVSIFMSAESFIPVCGKPNFLEFGGQRVLRIVRKPLSATDRVLKRVFDFYAAIFLIILFSPLLAAVIAIVKLDSPGPALFKQKRRGFNQMEFMMFKFRTMRIDADKGTFTQTKRLDPRVTRVGKVLRRFSIDELPQLFNVLRGEMSLVGPRPHALEHDEILSNEVAAYARRYNMKPGITGLAQAQGFRGAIDTTQQMEGRMDRDLQYIENWSLVLDVKILLMTVFTSTASKNAY
jgi:Undecaprenyl-phosphate glucose phosphotransferase